jgi:hypothetical protein
VSAMLKSWKTLALAGVALTAVGCGKMATDSRSPVQLTLLTLEAASGAMPDEFGSTLHSDVITNIQQTIGGQQVSVPTIFGDNGAASFAIVLKDPGSDPSSPVAPSALNAVTITRYRVVYRRTDGRNTPGVDVPYPFDSAVTVTVTGDGGSTGFQLVRTSAKQEAPLRLLVNNPDIISTIADVTFYGRDQAGNDVSATGSIGIDFGNFGDPQ